MADDYFLVGDDFEITCNALCRGDSTVTRILLFVRHKPQEMSSFGRRLGTALQENAIVNEIRLDLKVFLADRIREEQKSDASKESTTRVASENEPLLAWLRSSPSLQTVQLLGNYIWHYSVTEMEVDILQEILVAMAANPRIESLVAMTPPYPLPLWTDYLMASKQLKSLTLYLHNNATDLEWQTAAEAVGSLPVLETLKLQGQAGLILRRLHEQFSDCKTTPISRRPPWKELLLQVCTETLMSESEATLVSSVWSSSEQLKTVSLEMCRFDPAAWRLLMAGLRSNPSIVHLKLYSCHFTAEAEPLFLNSFLSSSSSLSLSPFRNTASLALQTQQHSVRHLELILCKFLFPDESAVATKIANMLCTSQLDHVTLDSDVVQLQDELTFFQVLSANSVRVQLRSLELNGVSDDILEHVALFLPLTVHLERLVVQINYQIINGDVLPTTEPAFLAGLRRNGSLRSVEIRYTKGVGTVPLANALHLIEAFTMRNRTLPDLIKSTFAVPKGSGNDSTGTDSTTTFTQFPTLCQAARPAQRMAPTIVLRGLLAASEVLSFSKNCNKGKRIMSTQSAIRMQ